MWACVRPVVRGGGKAKFFFSLSLCIGSTATALDVNGSG